MEQNKQDDVDDENEEARSIIWRNQFARQQVGLRYVQNVQLNLKKSGLNQEASVTGVVVADVMNRVTLSVEAEWPIQLPWTFRPLMAAP